MSAAEERAWQTLRLLREEGVHVVRQHKIGRFTVDFAVRKRRLAIEIDGGVHDLPGRRDEDAKRQAQLEGIRWTFLRLPSQLAYDPDTLIDRVRAALPSPRGEGAGGGARRDAAETNASVESASAPDSADTALHPAPLPPPLEGRGNLRRTRANRVLPPRRKS